jgi:uncharacterized membrane protein
MRLTLTLLAAIGMALSSAALKEHYNVGASPCSINDRWDCGAVNHSPYADIHGVPVAAIGIGGYLLLAILVWTGPVQLLLVSAGAALGFSLQLTALEASVLQVWCIYCVGSLAVIALMTLLALVYSIASFRTMKKSRSRVGELTAVSS